MHPDAHGRGIGRLIATGLEEDAARRRRSRIQNGILEADSAARGLLESLGYGAVRVFRELRIDLQAPPPPPEWPDGLRVVPFDPERDALEFHAAHQETFADAWDFTPRDFESWSKDHLGSERFDPTLWCVVRAGDELVAGTICTGDTYGGGWVHVLFTRRPWRGQGVGAALLADSFGRFWERGEHNVGLGVDAASDTRSVPPLRARRDGARARLGRVREGTQRRLADSGRSQACPYAGAAASSSSPRP